MVNTRNQNKCQNELVKEFESSVIDIDTTTQTSKIGDFELTFDFDHASRCWRINKKQIGDGTYYYICGFIKKDGKPCQNPTHCRIHNRL